MCAHLEEPPPVGDANPSEVSNAKESSSAASRRKSLHLDESDDANSDDDKSISTPLTQNKAIKTLYKLKGGRGLQSVSALGTPETLTLPLTLNLNVSFPFFVGKRSFDSPSANGGGGGTGGGGGGAGGGGGGVAVDDAERRHHARRCVARDTAREERADGAGRAVAVV